MVKFFPRFFLTLGSAGNSSIYIKDGNGDWQEFINYEYFKIIKRQNQVSEFELKIMDLETAEKLYVKEFAEVMFFSETNLILKGRIQKINYLTSFESDARGFGMEAKLLEKELIKSGDKRVQYTNISAQTIANEILSSGTDGTTPWIITPNTTGLFAVDYGVLSIRFEYGNRLNSIAKLTQAIDYEWRVTQDVGFVDFFDLAPLLPNSTRATVSQETFEITGANTNASQTSKEKDIINLANKIDVLGYGDGINQKHTSTYSASLTFSTLSADITATSTTISLIDASSFPVSGEIRIAEERITYTGKSSNDLTGGVRGTSSTTALPHKKNVYTEIYKDIDSPESGSSVETNGLIDYTITERNVTEVETLELIASRELLERKDAIERIIVIPSEPLETAGSREIGDLVTVTDAESDISGTFRIVGMTYISNYGDLSLEIELSNRSLTFIEQMQKQREANDNLSKYMQGATNIYAISEAENCDSTHNLNLIFFVPNEAVAINQVLLNFKLRDYRAYTTTTAAGSAHTHNLSISDSGAHTHTVSGATTTSESTHDHTGAISGDGSSSAGVHVPSIDGGVLRGDVPASFNSFDVSESTDSHNHTISGQTAASDTHTHTGQATDSESAHTHGQTYGINETILVSPSVDLYTGEDGGSMTLKDTYTTDQTEINVTSEVVAVGAGKWVNLQFRVNKNMRIEANAYVKIFIEST